MLIKDLPPEILFKIFLDVNKHFRVRATSRLFRDVMTAGRPELVYVVGGFGHYGLAQHNSKLQRAKDKEATKVTAVTANLVDLASKFTLRRIILNGMTIATHNDVSPALGPDVRYLGLNFMFVTAKWLAPGLSTCSNLYSLSLFDTPLYPAELVLLGKVLPTSLRSLTLNRVGMNEDEGIAGVAAGIARLYALEVLNVSNNSFRTCAALSVAMSVLRNLTHMECVDHDLNDAGFEQLLDGLANSRNLRVLSIHKDGLDPRNLTPEEQEEQLVTMRRIVKKLSAGFFKLEILCLTGLRLAENVLDLEIQSIRVKELRLVNCVIDDDGLTALLAGLATCPRLETLDLENNYITDDGMELFVRFTEGRRHLELVRVDGNEATNPTLRQIGNRLRVSGVRLSSDYEDSAETSEASESVTHEDVFGDGDSD